MVHHFGMRFALAIALFFVGAQLVMAQSIIVDRQVVGSAGALSNTGSAVIDAQIGETVIATGESTSFSATQGFEQPRFRNIISAVIETAPESCLGANDGAAFITSISGCEGPYNILWDNGNAGMNANGYASGAHIVTIVTDNCQTQIPFFVERLSDAPCQLIFYSGITPNDDGDNDYWHIENIELPQFARNTVRIFNRWGEEVWSANGYDNNQVRWEGQGRTDGDLPDGTYYYVVEINSTTYKGYIELTR